MEANKGEAVRAAQVGKKYLGVDNDKAIKFFTKSLKLYPTDEVKQLLVQAQKLPSENQENTRFGNTNGMRHRHVPAAKPKKEEPPSRSFTPEQAKAVNRVKACKDFYEILGVPRNADDAQIKKAYRKMALKLHPDKNAAPGADEAFKEVGRAWAVLSDGDKRAHYDQFGSEDAPARRYHQRYHDEIDPEEIFNMFFGGGMGMRGGFGGPGVRMYRFGGNRGQQRGQTQQQGSLLQLLPLLLLFALSFLNLNSGGETNLFSLEQTHTYPIARKTRIHGIVPDIPFWVNKDFNSKYGRNRQALGQIERQVEAEYTRVVHRHCQVEKKRRDTAIYHARKSRDATKLKRANEMKMKMCDEYQRIQSFPGY